MAKAWNGANRWSGNASQRSLIFLVAAASDGLDGYVARRYNQRSALGVILDPIADKGLLLSGIITLSISNWSHISPEYGKFPAWFPVLVIARDLVILIGSVVLHLLNGKVRGAATLDRESGDLFADDRDRLGHAATAFSPAHLCGGGRGSFHLQPPA